MSEESIRGVLDGYAAATDDFLSRSEAVSSDLLFGPFLDLFPEPPAHVADVGAGTGRDAAWLIERGYDVTAIEPVAALRQAGMRLHPDHEINWRDAALPDLLIPDRFDMVVLSAVWQHLDDADRALAMPRIAALTEMGGLVLISLRQGPEAPSREIFDISIDATIALAAGHGLWIERQVRIESMQAENRAAGIYWTWLALRRVAR